MRLTRSFIRDDCERRSEKSMAVSGRGTIPGQRTHVTQVNSGVISFSSILIQLEWTVTYPGPRRRLWSGRRAAAAGSGWTLIHVEYTTHCQRGGEQHRTASLTPRKHHVILNSCFIQSSVIIRAASNQSTCWLSSQQVIWGLKHAHQGSKTSANTLFCPKLVINIKEIDNWCLLTHLQ